MMEKQMEQIKELLRSIDVNIERNERSLAKLDQLVGDRHAE